MKSLRADPKDFFSKVDLLSRQLSRTLKFLEYLVYLMALSIFLVPVLKILQLFDFSNLL